MLLAVQKRTGHVHARTPDGFTACGRWAGRRASWRLEHGRPVSIDCGHCLNSTALSLLLQAAARRRQRAAA